MNLRTTFFLLVLLIAVVLVIPWPRTPPSRGDREGSAKTSPSATEPASREENKSTPPWVARTGPEVEIAYFSEWHEPYGSGLPTDVLDRIWRSINAVPTARGGREDEAPWEFAGPISILVLPIVNSSMEYMGRILDFEIDLIDSTQRIGAASGGLFEKSNEPPIGVTALSDDLETLVIGSFQTNPNNPDDILMGTGEPGFPAIGPIRTGRGLFRTLDRGQTWFSVPMGPVGDPILPGSFYRVRFDPSTTNRIHIACDQGYFRSDDGGQTFARYLEGWVTDIGFHLGDPNLLLAGRWHERDGNGDPLGGVHRSTDGGTTWQRLTTPGVPSLDVGRISIAVGPLQNPGQPPVYASISDSAGRALNGIYRSLDFGDSWTDVSPPPEESLEGQGYYNNAIVVNHDPDSSSVVTFGWVNLYRSTDAGASWVVQDHPGGSLHADFHLLRSIDPHHIIAASDGGLHRWPGPDWHVWSIAWRYPITQFYHIDVDPTDLARLVGGSQDNGIAYGEGLGPVIWNQGQGGDGGGVAIQFTNQEPHPFWVTNGVCTGQGCDGLQFRNFRSTDDGATWDVLTDGMDPSSVGTRRVRTPRVPGSTAIITHAGPFVYRFDHDNQAWVKLNASDPFEPAVRNIAIADSSGVVLWVTTFAGTGGRRVMYRDANGDWHNRSAGLPDAGSSWKVRYVVGDRYGRDPLLGYALMDGLWSGLDGQKIFKTIDGGVTWENITGDLPNLPLADIVENPSDPDRLYLATEFGAFTSEDGGQTWSTWNDGWPRAIIVMEFVPAFLPADAEYWIYAATHGRSVYRRSLARTISMDAAESGGQDRRLLFAPPAPNPFRGSTVLRFRLPAETSVNLTIFGADGRRVRDLVRGVRQAGWHQTTWDGLDEAGRKAAPSVYFARVRANGHSETRRITRTP